MPLLAPSADRLPPPVHTLPDPRARSSSPSSRSAWATASRWVPPTRAGTWCVSAPDLPSSSFPIYIYSSLPLLLLLLLSAAAAAQDLRLCTRSHEGRSVSECSWRCLSVHSRLSRRLSLPEQPENSPLNVGMAPASWRNSYYAPDAATPWTMQFYDYPGSLDVPEVDPRNPINEYVLPRITPAARARCTCAIHRPHVYQAAPGDAHGGGGGS